MPSRRRQTRAAIQHPHPTSGGHPLPSSSSNSRNGVPGGGRAPVVPGMTQGMARLTFNGGDVTVGKRIDSLNCPLMRLPRNIRDDIYAMLLTAPPESEKPGQAGDDKGKSNSCHSSTRPAAIIERNQILPGSSQRYPFITEAMGLLLVNKQLHCEASEYLFSNNTFVIMPDWERVHCFWSCNNNVCRPDIPCLVHLRNFRQLRHLYILLNNPHNFEDKPQKYAANRLRQNLKTMARCLRESDVRLLTLKVRYVSCLRGQIDSVRDRLDAEPGAYASNCTITLHSAYGDQDYSFQAGEDHSILFQNTSVLDELTALSDIAKSVMVVGDLSTSYIADLTRVLAAPPDRDEDDLVAVDECVEAAGLEVPVTEVVGSNGSTQPTGLDVQEAVATGNKATQCLEEDDAKARTALLKKLWLEHPEDKEMHDFCEKTMRGPMYTAAFMEQMLVPTKEEVACFRAARKQQKRKKKA